MMRTLITFIIVIVSCCLINCLESDDTDIHVTTSTAVYDTVSGNQANSEGEIEVFSLRPPINDSELSFNTTKSEEITSTTITSKSTLEEVSASEEFTSDFNEHEGSSTTISTEIFLDNDFSSDSNELEVTTTTVSTKRPLVEVPVSDDFSLDFSEFEVTSTSISTKSTPEKGFRFEYNESENELEPSGNYTCTKCDHKLPKITNFTSRFTPDNKMVLSWDPLHETLSECQFQFTINDTSSHKSFPYFRREESNNHVIENVKKCDKYEFIIEANNKCGFQDIYTTTVYTDPVEVYGLSINIENNLTNISWFNAVNTFCEKYKIHINGNVYDTEENFYLVDGSLFCFDISVQAVREDNKTGLISHTLVPGMPKHIQIDNSVERALQVKWDPPEEDSCVHSYEINLTLKDTDEIINSTITQGTEIHYDNLESCAFYIVSVAALSGENKGRETVGEVRTKIPETLKKVRNASLSYNLSRGELIAEWNDPDYQKACVTGYKIDHSEEEKLSTYSTAGTKIIFPPVIGCKEYDINITAQSDDKNSEVEHLMIKIPDLKPRMPECVVEETGKTTALLNCSTETYAENMCKLLSMQVLCTDGHDNQMVNQTINDDTSRPSVEVTVSGLSEYTKYVCSVTLENNGGFSRSSRVVEFITNEGEPSQPERFKSEKVRATGFDLSWELPSRPRGVIRSYKLIIEPVEVLHYIPVGCATMQEKMEYVLEANVNNFTYLNTLPNYKYRCKISAETIGFGDVNEVYVTTSTNAPEPPRDLTFQLIYYSKHSYNASVKLQWLTPCNSNGKIKHFLINLDGSELERPMTKSDEREFEIPPSEFDEYIKIIMGLKANHAYTVSIRTFLESGEKSKAVSVNFRSPVKYSDPPEIVDVVTDTLDTITVYWKKPEQINGMEWRYELYFQSLGPIHEHGGFGCTYPYWRYTYIQPYTTLSYTFPEALPNYKYNISITVVSTLGTQRGDESEGFIFVTNRTRSEAVRDLRHQVINEPGPDYNANYSLNFKIPCNMNGPLLFYEILLSGVNELNEQPIHQNISSSQLSHEVVLIPAYTYFLFVTVVTNCGNEPTEDEICRSDTVERNFTSPSGVPIQSENITEIVKVLKIDLYQVTVSIRKDLFKNDNGQILYYAIILNDKLYYDEDEENYGTWNSDQWPDLGKWANYTSKVYQYQATPDCWAPFDEGEIVEYVLGEQNFTDGEEVYNGPLLPGIEYSMEIRGFTRHAYLDSEVIFFKTLDLEDLEKANGVVWVIIINVIILSIVLISLITYYFIKKRSSGRNNNVIEEEDLQMPVSVGDFHYYYTELSVRGVDVFKNEYAAINTRSAEDSSPTSEALLPENRKKNRYINILPYDATRVLLKDGISDYINASYITGYSEEIEYIATQGPLESTYLDFWRMIIEENVTVIVMVAQFTEQKKEKCYKYVPEDHEQIEVDELTIRCAAKLDFTSHCERHIKIQKDGEQHEITHLQFLNWPDFGCPSGTDNMLHFCRVMRSRIEQDPGRIVVHCSAGVGRTGTLIALDILLQTVDADRGIDVFNTVLNLRKQRKNMVQTESQYLYIYSCIHDAITNPKVLESVEVIKVEEPIYENVNDIELKVLNSNNNEQIETDN